MTDRPAGPAAPEASLETKRLRLRRLTPEDAAGLFGCTGDPEVMRYWYPGPDADIADAARRIAEMEAHWRRCGFGDFAVLARDSSDLIGFAGLHHITGMDEVNVGYALVPSRWRMGLGTELCRSLLTHGFRVLDLPEIVAVIDPRNTASVALAERCGLGSRLELTWQGQPRVLHAITCAEFEA
jgi:RimJ/RimL family protein N-acetyltransferase